MKLVDIVGVTLFCILLTYAIFLAIKGGEKKEVKKEKVIYIQYNNRNPSSWSGCYAEDKIIKNNL